ncbi:MAG: ABC transporter permease [Polyangiales bacterium]
MNYALGIGFQYLRSKKQSTVSVITVIAVAGVALGVGALLAVLSIANGFLDEIRDKVLGVNAHVIVLKYGLDFGEYREVIDDSLKMPEVKGAAPFLVNEMMLAKGKRLSGVLVKGVAPEGLSKVLDLRNQIVDGHLDGLRLPDAKPPASPDTGNVGDMDLDAYLDALAHDAGTRGGDARSADGGVAGAIQDGDLSDLLDRAVRGDPLVDPKQVEAEERAKREAEAKASELPKVRVPTPEEMNAVLHDLDQTGGLPDDDTERLIFEEEGAEVDADAEGDRKKLPGIVVGRTLAKNLGLGVGDRVQLVSPLTGLDTSLWEATPRVPKSKEFRVIAIFEAGFQEYDSRLVYVDLYEAQSFFDHGDTVMGVEISLNDIEQADGVARKLEHELGGGPYHAMSWQELNQNLFTALRIQKRALGLTIATIVVVAAFNVIATLIMIVLEKKKEIAILKAMGAKGRSILTIFFVQGTVVGLVGTAIGLVLGGGAVAYLTRYRFPLDPKVYLVDHLPIRMSITEFLVTIGVALGICMTATLLPSWWAARLSPVDGVRHE